MSDTTHHTARHLSGRKPAAWRLPVAHFAYAASEQECGALLNTHIAALGLPPRTKNALQAGGIRSLSDLVTWTERDLCTLPQCGPAGIAMIRRALRRMGLRLGLPALDALSMNAAHN